MPQRLYTGSSSEEFGERVTLKIK